MDCKFSVYLFTDYLEEMIVGEIWYPFDTRSKEMYGAVFDGSLILCNGFIHWCFFYYFCLLQNISEIFLPIDFVAFVPKCCQSVFACEWLSKATFCTGPLYKMRKMKQNRWDLFKVRAPQYPVLPRQQRSRNSTSCCEKWVFPSDSGTVEENERGSWGKGRSGRSKGKKCTQPGDLIQILGCYEPFATLLFGGRSISLHEKMCNDRQ